MHSASAITALALGGVLSLLASPTRAMPICSAWKGASYEEAKANSTLAEAINVVQSKGTVPWYTDNLQAADLDKVLQTLSTNCNADTKIPLVVYGIPNKDCVAGDSNHGSNKNMDDYKTFLDKLTKTFPTQNMIYIIEPDALGLSVGGGCAIEKDYPGYIKVALETLSSNPNAELFLDVGFWTLGPGSANGPKLIELINKVWPAKGNVKGIALNTSNYQKTEKLLGLCEWFVKESGKRDAKCVIDTSRNHKGMETPGAWCNVANTGIGAPPTMDTGNPLAAYYLWVKPPGESDGKCKSENPPAMKGPTAGKFFKEHFEMMWNNGYFVEKGEGKPIGGGTSPPAGPAGATPPQPPSGTVKPAGRR